MGGVGVGQPGFLGLSLAEEIEEGLVLGNRLFGGGEREIGVGVGVGVCGGLNTRLASFFGDGKGWEREKVG